MACEDNTSGTERSHLHLTSDSYSRAISRRSQGSPKDMLVDNAVAHVSELSVCMEATGYVP